MGISNSLILHLKDSIGVLLLENGRQKAKSRQFFSAIDV